ncbi:hypothetical protein FOL47_006645 [Perkinsus chesapeaki]|uniref:Uncharacterized protein n=1 Tax=Perkinsus chesapeaki TaxID=330153 RepID=A0A7J6LR60_PERCH|nr:hypothetical protein FOL47_006645 [Perkinsus chesapeaki]
MDLTASQRFQPVTAREQELHGYPVGLMTSQSLSATVICMTDSLAQHNGVRAPSYVPNPNMDHMESSVYSEAIREDSRPTDVLPPQSLATYLDCAVQRLHSLLSFAKRQELRSALARWSEVPTLAHNKKEFHRAREQLISSMRRERKDHDYAITRWAIKAQEVANDVLAAEEIDKEYGAKIAECHSNWESRHLELRDQLRTVVFEDGVSRGLVLLKNAIGRSTHRTLQSTISKWKDLASFLPGDVFGDSARIVSGLFPEASTAVGSRLTTIAVLTHSYEELDTTINRYRAEAYRRLQLEQSQRNRIPADILTNVRDLLSFGKETKEVFLLDP